MPEKVIKFKLRIQLSAKLIESTFLNSDFYQINTY